jgi:heme/copper-type cytochrome/quinol oxidase subunit 2
MKRDTVINVLLIIAGIVLAIALFGAGVLWKSRAAKGPRALTSPVSVSSIAKVCWRACKSPPIRTVAAAKTAVGVGRAASAFQCEQSQPAAEPRGAG